MNPWISFASAVWRWFFRWLFSYTPTAASNNSASRSPSRSQSAASTIGDANWVTPTHAAGGPGSPRRSAAPRAKEIALNAEDSMLAAMSQKAMKPEEMVIALNTLRYTILVLLDQPSSAFAARVFIDAETDEKMDGLAMVEMQLQNLEQLRRRLRNYLWGD
jgi:hypothetical protein